MENTPIVSWSNILRILLFLLSGSGPIAWLLRGSRQDRQKILDRLDFLEKLTREQTATIQALTWQIEALTVKLNALTLAKGF